MKALISLITILCIAGLFSCQPTQLHRQDGWYVIDSNDSLSNEAIISTNDFEALRLDSFVNPDNVMIYLITGRVIESKRGQWADATEKAIGKQIAFVFNDTVITKPQVNARIDGGSFQISSPYGHDLKTIYNEIRK